MFKSALTAALTLAVLGTTAGCMPTLVPLPGLANASTGVTTPDNFPYLEFQVLPEVKPLSGTTFDGGDLQLQVPTQWTLLAKDQTQGAETLRARYTAEGDYRPAVALEIWTFSLDVPHKTHGAALLDAAKRVLDRGEGKAFQGLLDRDFNAVGYVYSKPVEGADAMGAFFVKQKGTKLHVIDVIGGYAHFNSEQAYAIFNSLQVI